MLLKVMQVLLMLKFWIHFILNYNLKILNLQLKNKLIDSLSELKGSTSFRVKIQSDDKTLYSTFYSNSKVETIINESDIDDVFESIYNTIISKIQIL